MKGVSLSIVLGGFLGNVICSMVLPRPRVCVLEYDKSMASENHAGRTGRITGLGEKLIFLEYANRIDLS